MALKFFDGIKLNSTRGKLLNTSGTSLNLNQTQNHSQNF